ncbi:unnamed protein product [Staurois parvus]|uniref:Uncharacterized protein n=1 Tax=Staurois parvus TaxID=386267 RepID=A0ABN9CS27_9NEOB|nr:unnamed protein product [Staurois parvus]
MLRRWSLHEFVKDWTWGWKDRLESRMTPSTLACGAGLMVALLDVMERSMGGGVRAGGGKTRNSVLERISLRKWSDIQSDMSFSRFLIWAETEGVRWGVER